MGIEQRQEDDLRQIMKPDEFSQYSKLVSEEKHFEMRLYYVRKEMRKMRANARRRIKRVT